ncbi:MAG TPA: hypothetical protein VFN97_15140 [Actinospica sp.]|nr:hypothetical protein [Actinospica sp.]
MRNRRFLVPAALVGAFGITLVPAATAEASSSAAVGHATTPNPHLTLTFANSGSEAHDADVIVRLAGLAAGSATVSIDWGDGSVFSTESVSATAATDSGINLSPVRHTYTALGTYKLTAVVDDGQGDMFAGHTVVATGSEFTPFGPARILDTRKNLGATGPLGSKGIARLQVTGVHSGTQTVPAGITAVVLNVTATQETAGGFLSVYSNEDLAGAALPVPTTSNLNFGPSQNVANLVIVPVGADGKVDFSNGSAGSTHVIADIAGYFTATSTASRYLAMTPTRILDTRKGLGAAKPSVAGGHSIDVTVAGQNGIPSDATAVAMNITSAGSTAGGYITAYPTGQALPNVSDLNYSTGVDRANMAIVPIGANGRITFANGATSGHTDLIADVSGYYTRDAVTGASTYNPFTTPIRYFDSRGTGTDADLGDLYPGPLAANKNYPIPVSSPDSPYTAMVYNVTVTQPTGGGYLALDPYDPSYPSTPTTSNLNFSPGQTVPNLAIATPGNQTDPKFGTYDDAAIYLGATGTAQVVIDWFGIFSQ